MKSNNPVISVVVPEYYGEKMVHELVRRLVLSLETISNDYEIILVNDASPDDTWLMIQKECNNNPKVKGINLSRNFGQPYAISAGLSYAKGDWVVVMDCDLQDVPEEIPNLYSKALEGFDIVVAKRLVKHVGWWKQISSKIFHWFFNFLSGSKSDSSESNFGIYKKSVITTFNNIPSYTRSFSTMIRTFGFKKTHLVIEQAERAEGHSSYTLRKLLRITYEVIISNTNRPLRFAVAIGFTLSLLSFLLALYNVIARLTGIITLPGYTTTVFSIWFVGGLILLVSGVLGLYIGKIFDQVKGLPPFIIRDTINTDC